MLIQLQIYDYMFKIWVLPYCAFLKLSYGNSLSRTEEDADVSFLNLDISSWLYCHDEFGYIEQVHFAIAIAIASCLYVSMVIATHLYCEGDMYHLCFIMVLCLYCESALSWHHQLFSFGFTCAMYVLILIWNLNKDMRIYMRVFLVINHLKKNRRVKRPWIVQFGTCCACTCKDYVCRQSLPKWHCQFGSSLLACDSKILKIVQIYIEHIHVYFPIYKYTDYIYIYIYIYSIVAYVYVYLMVMVYIYFNHELCL